MGPIGLVVGRSGGRAVGRSGGQAAHNAFFSSIKPMGSQYEIIGKIPTPHQIGKTYLLALYCTILESGGWNV